MFCVPCKGCPRKPSVLPPFKALTKPAHGSSEPDNQRISADTLGSDLQFELEHRFPSADPSALNWTF